VPADWDHWRHKKRCALWEAAALTLDVDPRAFHARDMGVSSWAVIPRTGVRQAGDPRKLGERIEIALSNLGDGIEDMTPFSDGHRFRTEVRLPDFGSWAEKIWPDLPKDFPRSTPTGTRPAGRGMTARPLGASGGGPVDDDDHDPSRPRKPDWSIWGLVEEASIQDTIVLSCNISPDWFRKGIAKSSILDSITHRINAIKTLDRSGTIIPGITSRTDLKTRKVKTSFKLRSFRRWAEATMKWGFPDEFPKDPPAPVLPLALPHPSAPPVPVSSAGPWPWGAYETPNLRHLAMAAKEFWADGYDPGSAPTNEGVAEWLEKKGASGRIAIMIAQILRSPNVPFGPRKKRPKKK
jgi:hypothetical protein